MQNEKATWEKDKARLQLQLEHRKRTWQQFKEMMDSEGGAESSLTPLKRGYKNGSSAASYKGFLPRH
jgi:hypothetical protein